MNCIIIDDEATARIIVQQLCSTIENLNVVEEFPNAIQALMYLNKQSVDLIFLDIHMPDFTGFDLIQTLKNPPKIIVTTSDKDFALKAFDYDCIVDFLLKPIAKSRFLKAIKKVEKSLLLNNSEKKSNKQKVQLENDLYVNIDRRLIKINIPSIYLIKSKGDYIQIKTEEKNYVVHTTLKKIADKLPDSLFLRVHRSYIINLKKIIDIKNNSVLIKKFVIPISRTSKPELMKRLNLL